MSDQLYEEIGLKFAKEFETTLGQMFGKPCLKVNNKAFAAFFKGEMVFKLGQEHIANIKDELSGSVNWDPSGKKRPMKDWLQVPVDFSSRWDELAKEALHFVKNT